MKKLVLLTLALLLLLAACAREDTPAPTQPTETTTEAEEPTAPVSGTIPSEITTQAEELGLDIGITGVEEVYPLPNSDDPMMYISLAVPSDTGIENADVYYQQWLDDTLYYISLEQADLEYYLNEGGTIHTQYMYEAGFNVPRNDGLVLSISRSYATYTGGAHGSTTWYGETFVAESGALLTLGDLFTVPGDIYLPRLVEAVLAQIRAEGRQDGLFGNYPQLIQDTMDPRSFYLTDTGLTLFWQEYDIAPYAAGPQFFEIPYEQLADIMDSQWLPL